MNGGIISQTGSNNLLFARRQFVGGAVAVGTMALSGCASNLVMRNEGQQSIRPGQVWLDTAGKPIQAHAGAVIAVGNTFYWYGENKEFTDGKQNIESWGIRFYRSKDLYNWEDLGAIIPPDQADPTSPLSPRIFPERPHIVYNPRTRKFVCWIKIRNPKLPYQFRSVLVADRITGPYEMVRRELRPEGLSIGDFDLVVDERSGKAYMYAEQGHKEVVCLELTDDWTNFTGQSSIYFPNLSPPETKEGIACFQKSGKLFLTSSQMTGYFPNPSSIAVADGANQPFTALGDLHPADRSRSSFNSQISSIFKHPDKRNLYIALADRWLPAMTGRPDFENGELSGHVRSAVGKATSKPRQPFTEQERAAIGYAAALTHVNTSISRYVWLPIEFNGRQPVIDWRDEWRVEEFD